VSLTKRQTTGPVQIIPFKRRKQKRNKQRLLESVASDWQRWEKSAKFLGLNWSEFARRAMNTLADKCEQADMPIVSEKPVSKNGAAARAKARRPVAREKATSRTKRVAT
jgi:hypothetical protein